MESVIIMAKMVGLRGLVFNGEKEYTNEIQPDYMIAEYVERYSASLGEISLFVK